MIEKDSFRIAIVKSITSVVGFFFSLVMHVIEELIESLKSEPTTPYQGALLPESELLSHWNTGWSIGSKKLDLNLSIQGLLCLGGTGTGKTSNVAITTLNRPGKASYVCLSPSGDIPQKTSGYLASIGHRIQHLRFEAPFHDQFNPLSRCENALDIRKAATMIYQATMGTNSKDSFWDAMGIELLSIIFTLVLSFEEENQNLCNANDVLNLMSTDPDKVDALVVGANIDKLYQDYMAFCTYEEKLRTNVIATCRPILAQFGQETLAMFTSGDTIDIQSYRKEPSVLFIEIPVADQAFYAGITSILFQQLFTKIFSSLPRKGDLPIFFLLEEFGILKKIPIMPTVLSNIRKYYCGCCLLLQEESMLYDIYGKIAASMIANCQSHLIFTNQPLSKAQEMSTLIGKHEVKDEHGVKKVQSVLTADSIRAMDPKYALLKCGHKRISKVRLRPYYKNLWLRHRAKMAPAELPIISMKMPPLLRDKAI